MDIPTTALLNSTLGQQKATEFAAIRTFIFFKEAKHEVAEEQGFL